MKKTLALFLALTLSFGLLAGCGGTASAPESSAPASVSVQEPENAPKPPAQEEAPAPAEPASLAEEPLSAEEPEAFEIAETADLPISEAPFSFTMWAQAPPGA